MKKWQSRLVLLVSPFVLFLSGCHRSNDFLYYSGAQPVATSYKIKDIVGNSKLDMLWVIDNSGSMEAYQTSVANNTTSFINTIEQGKVLDWKIGLISTDTSDSPYVGMAPGDDLNSSTPDGSGKFITAVSRLGTNGDSVEKTFLPVENSLNAYPQFLRQQAMLAIILISDAPEQSPTSAADFLAFLKNVKGSLHNVVFYGALCPEQWCTPTDDTWDWAGSKFQEIYNALGGKVFPICDPNFGANIVSIGQDIVQRLAYPKIYLQERPILSTLKVVYNGKELPPGSKDEGGYWLYDYDNNAVVFNDLSFAPGDQEQVEVTYQPAPANQ